MPRVHPRAAAFTYTVPVVRPRTAAFTRHTTHTRTRSIPRVQVAEAALGDPWVRHGDRLALQASLKEGAPVACLPLAAVLLVAVLLSVLLLVMVRQSE